MEVTSICFHTTLPQSPAVTSRSPVTLCKALAALKQPDSGCPLCTCSASTAWDASTLHSLVFYSITCTTQHLPHVPHLGQCHLRDPHSSSCGCHRVALWNGIHRA